ncbi:MAG: acyl carrier protein [Casimicrobiaceae bacterium]|jgi:acyl carrier protein
MDDTFSKVKALMVQEFELPADSVTPTTELTALGVDSLAALEFVFDLEDAFGVTMGTETDLRGGTVQDVVAAVDAALVAQSRLPAAA